MKTSLSLLALSFFVVASVAACSAANDEPSSPSEETSESSENLSSTAVAHACPAGERVCVLANAHGVCAPRCVPAGVMCAHPTCRVCDPPGGPPREGCKWDPTACVWLCL